MKKIDSRPLDDRPDNCISPLSSQQTPTTNPRAVSPTKLHVPQRRTLNLTISNMSCNEHPTRKNYNGSSALYFAVRSGLPPYTAVGSGRAMCCREFRGCADYWRASKGWGTGILRCAAGRAMFAIEIILIYTRFSSHPFVRSEFR
jgi:hypothetical protein